MRDRDDRDRDDPQQPPTTMATIRDDDPLARVMAPPPGETADDRQARLHAEAEAKRISDAIDDELKKYVEDPERIVRESAIVALDMSEFEKSGDTEYALIPQAAAA